MFYARLKSVKKLYLNNLLRRQLILKTRRIGRREKGKYTEFVRIKLESFTNKKISLLHRVDIKNSVLMLQFKIKIKIQEFGN